jgi:hypothetical protein
MHRDAKLAEAGTPLADLPGFTTDAARALLARGSRSRTRRLMPPKASESLRHPMCPN